MHAKSPGIEFRLAVEYIEIYNEELRDLLHPDTAPKVLLMATCNQTASGALLVS